MSDKQAENWGNYWQGRAASEAGAALVGVGVETDAEIGAFWTAQLAGLKPSSSLLDMACGAGSVVRRALECGLTDVTGVDISSEAIATLKTAFPVVKGVVAPADATGLPDQNFDIAASQFGFEYADAPKAAAEAARLLKTGGSFIALAHSEDSAIEAEVSRLGADARAIADSGFTAAAKGLFTAAKSGADDEAFAQAAAAFSAPQAKVLAIARRAKGLAAHFYEGTQTLYQRREAYSLADMTGWLDGMEAEIAAFVGRMDSMRHAALSRAQAEAVLTALEAGGLTPEPLEPFISESTGETIGWILRAGDKASPR